VTASRKTDLNKTEPTLIDKKVVLIENNPDHAELIVESLVEGDAGDNIILLKDGMEALDFFENADIEWQIENEIRLIIIDLKIEKVDGMDILKFLKKNSRYNKIPAIIFSTTSDKETIDEAYKNGANGYFVKPIDQKDFIEKMEILKKYC
jgi:two-component system response regulator